MAARQDRGVTRTMKALVDAFGHLVEHRRNGPIRVAAEPVPERGGADGGARAARLKRRRRPRALFPPLAVQANTSRSRIRLGIV
jgi:hypothetical protein